MTSCQLGSAFQSALNFAFSLHKDQRRKSADIPYFSHLMGVAALVLEYGGNETTAVAALLHDTVEDQGGEAADTLIERVFGIELAALVRACSEDKVLAWQERKQQYIDRIAHESASARLICAADKVHNLRTMLTQLRIQGNEVWTRFKGGRDKSLWFYESVLAALRQAASESDPPQLRYLVDELDSDRSTLSGHNQRLGNRRHSLSPTGKRSRSGQVIEYRQARSQLLGRTSLRLTLFQIENPIRSHPSGQFGLREPKAMPIMCLRIRGEQPCLHASRRFGSNCL